MTTPFLKKKCGRCDFLHVEQNRPVNPKKAYSCTVDFPVPAFAVGNRFYDALSRLVFPDDGGGCPFFKFKTVKQKDAA